MPIAKPSEQIITSKICNAFVCVADGQTEATITQVVGNSHQVCGGCRMVFNPDTGIFELKSTKKNRDCVDENAPIAMPSKS